MAKKSNRYDISSFMELGEILQEHGLRGEILPNLEEIEISDQYGNSVRKRFSDLLYGKEGCMVCIRKVVERFEKLKFPSMRGANAAAAI